MPLCLAASSFIALSKAKGPPTIQFLISPLRYISSNSLASTVSFIFGLTFSLAHINATFGSSISKALATEHAFSIICFLPFTSGARFIAASVIKNNLSYPSISNTATWLNILPVLNPTSLLSTAFNIIEVSTNPFITMSAFPLDTSSTAFRQASDMSLISINS